VDLFAGDLGGLRFRNDGQKIIDEVLEPAGYFDIPENKRQPERVEKLNDGIRFRKSLNFSKLCFLLWKN